MQRAAASTPPTTSQSESQGAETPLTKRQKTSHTPTSAATPNLEQQLIQAALSEEEGKREKAIERLAAEAGETKWVLSTLNVGAGEDKQGLRIETTGHSDVDQDAWRPATVGRRSFGRFNRELEVGSANSLFVIAPARLVLRICKLWESCLRFIPLYIRKGPVACRFELAKLIDIIHIQKHQNGATEISSSSSAEMLGTSDEDGEDGGNSDDPAGTRELIRASKEEALERTNAQRLERKQQRYVVIGAIVPELCRGLRHILRLSPFRCHRQ